MSRLMITLDVLGRRRRVPFKGTPEQHAELLAGQRSFVAKKRQALKHAQHASGAEKIKAVADYMSLLGSHQRIGAMLPLIEHEPADVFWPAFIYVWPRCDCAWEWNARLVEILRRVGPCRHYQYADDRGKFFDSLRDSLLGSLFGTIIVYRGASRSRIDGAISWTTDIDIARRFARGHRGIAVPDPVVAMGVIDKSEIFLATDDRSEREILALPHIIKIENFQSSADRGATEIAHIKQETKS